ncbi:hypothetical protein UFOVP449_113 [uncultured Caudovirales phage]|uniref:Uncharacterized protein n=1 Tax=uncultured Caudovirales phage TaxID=2100421 RepID=A0A6J5MCR1_9CAUD|nr:hypothetical protein UFOVP449_113 [uncultured Caudovirales phage]
MAENPLRNPNREVQIKRNQNDLKQSITLFDIDTAIIGYLYDVVLPTLDDNGQSVKMPVVYGNSERWESARLNGYLRDQKGKIQLPIFMIRRSGVAKNDSMPILNRHVSYQAVTKWSKENRYSRFNLLTGAQPRYEIYNITVPDYVEVTYECMGWAAYTEQVNEIVESLNWASDEYWGDKTKYKFMSTITDYNIINELDEGNQRINRVECSINVKAYLLPERFDGEETTKKSFGVRRVILTTEVDLTANGRMESQLVNPSQYNANKDVVDYLALNTTYTEAATSNGQTNFTVNGIKLITAPPLLTETVINTLTVNSVGYEVGIYKNATKLIQDTHFTATYVNNVLSLTFIGGTNYNTTDNLVITGKFITL